MKNTVACHKNQRLLIPRFLMPSRTMHVNLWAWLSELHCRSITQKHGSDGFAMRILSNQLTFLSCSPTDKHIQAKPRTTTT